MKMLPLNATPGSFQSCNCTTLVLPPYDSKSCRGETLSRAGVRL
jgi:hypothetical protein